MNLKNLKFFVSNESYFIVGQYQKDTCFYDEDIDVDRISLYKKVTMNILLGMIIQIKWILYHCN